MGGVFEFYNDWTSVSARSYSQVTISGGTFGDDLKASENSSITIYGTDFSIDGFSVGYGEIAVPSGILAGTLASGEMINNNFHTYEDASIVLAPEPAIEAAIDIDPDTLNLSSKGKWITCYICLPEDYDVADIDPNSVLLEYEIQPESFRLDEQQQVAIAKFSRSEVQGILDVGEVELTITGQLMDGTVFEGTDVIRVINKGSGKSEKTNPKQTQFKPNQTQFARG